MKKVRKPGSVITVLAGGTVVLFGGAALAATLPSSGNRDLAQMVQMAHAAGATPSHSTMSHAPAPAAPAGVAGVSTSRAPQPVADGSASKKASSPRVATLPSAPTPTSLPTHIAPASPFVLPHSVAPAQTKHAKTTTGPKSITYVVKPGDNLTVIAAWFKLHGYVNLYRANWKIIGSNPNLIIPGERITITDGQMTVKLPA